jgi:hypothetical protein
MKRKKIALAAILALAFFLVATGAALATSSASYKLPWDVLSGGGGDRSSSSYSLGDTIGQPSAIGLSESTNYRLGSGFWYGIPVVTGCLLGDANEDGVVDALDLQVEKQIIFGELPPTCGADANKDIEVNVLDLVEIKRIILGIGS